jgi:hypothetical protein
LFIFRQEAGYQIHLFTFIDLIRGWLVRNGLIRLILSVVVCHFLISGWVL